MHLHVFLVILINVLTTNCISLISILLLVLKEKREVDIAVFSELYRKLASQVILRRLMTDVQCIVEPGSH